MADNQPGDASFRFSGAHLILAAILAAAAAIRLAAADGDLWLDEIWSLDNLALAMTRTALADRAVLLFHDNTHPVNTLYLALVGPGAGALATRALSVFAGVCAVCVAAAIGWRRAPQEGLISAGMVAVSYPMVHYSSEARGYGVMLLAAMAAAWLMEVYLERPGRLKVAAFAAVSLLGIASHLTFLAALGGLGAWAAVTLFRRHGASVSTAARLVALFGVPLIAFEVFAIVAWDNWMIGGAPPADAADSAAILTLLTFGIDAYGGGPALYVLAMAAPALAAFTIWRLAREDDASWILFLLMVLVFPLALILIEQPWPVWPRYFIVSAPFALILAARGLSLLAAQGAPGRAVAAAALAGFAIGNAQVLESFFAAGRGHYGQALEMISANSTGPVSVSGYPEFSVGTLIAHHSRARGLDGTITFAPVAEDLNVSAPWFIDGRSGRHRPKPVISRSHGRTGVAAYRLVGVFPHWGLSGTTWALYRAPEGDP